MPLFSDRLYTSQNSDLKREARMGDDEARERGRVAELRRQGLICEDSAAHAAATATACGIASGCPDDVAEAARCSAAG